MKRQIFRQIIHLLDNNIEEKDIKFTKTYYRAYLYVIDFTVKEKPYKLRMYTIDGTAELLDGNWNELAFDTCQNNEELDKIYR